MPKYLYQAKTLQGKIVQGDLKANSKQEAQAFLQARQLIPIKILVASQIQSFASQQSQSTFFGSLFEPRVSLRQLQIFTRQFATLIHAGLPLVDTLQILTSHESKSSSLYKILRQVKMKIESGQNLSQAMLAFPKAFDTFYISMVKAGESGGILDKVLNRLSETLEKKRKLRQDMLSASFYPCAVMIFSSLVIVGIFVFIVPQFAEMYQKSNQQLPAMTQFTLQTSKIIREHWKMILFGILGSPLAFFYSYQSLGARRFWDTLFANFPFTKSLVQKSSITYFTQTLSSLLHAGVHMVESISIAARTCNNIFYQDIFEKSLGAIKQGTALSTYLQAQSSYIPSMLIQMIVVGEQSGNMDFMLDKVAKFYEEQVENTIKRIISLIEPLLIVVFGVMIAFVVLSIYLPIFNASSIVGQ